MQSHLEFARAHERGIIALIRELVECESPSFDAATAGATRGVEGNKCKALITVTANTDRRIVIADFRMFMMFFQIVCE